MKICAEELPDYDESMSESSGSPLDTPQHVRVSSNNRDNRGADLSEAESLLADSSNSLPSPITASAPFEAASSNNTVSGASAVALPSYAVSTTELGNEFGPPKLDLSAPPPYSELDEEGPVRSVVLHIDNPQSVASSGTEIVGVMLPGGGAAAASECMLPPSYEEVQRIKAVEAQLENGDHILLPPHTSNIGIGLPISGTVSNGDSTGDGRATEEDLLGTDLLFFLSFAAAFFFNWVGFVVLVCFCHSVAGRSGALAGFGLSLAKWAVIVRHSTVLAAQANTWLLWLIIVLGLVICMRAVLQYLNAKREWQHASAASRHRFLLFH